MILTPMEKESKEVELTQMEEIQENLEQMEELAKARMELIRTM